MFINLHVHSEYSLLDGMCSLKKLIPKVASLGQTAVAVTDHGNFHAAVKFYQACEKYQKDTGTTVKPIYGIEVYVTPSLDNVVQARDVIAANKEEKRQLKAKDKKLFNKPLKIKDHFDLLATENEDYFGNSTQMVSEDVEDETDGGESYRYSLAHLVLLAKNNKGFYNLMQIATDSQLLGFYNKPRVDRNLLKQYGEGIIALSACRGGEIPRLILRHREDLAIKLIEEYKAIFDEFYLELQPPVVPEQAYINEILLRLAEKTDTPLVATSDAHYLNEEDSAAHEELMKMQTGGKFWFEEKSYFIHTEEQMLAYGFPQVAIDNTAIIADQCNVTWDTGFKVPIMEVPEGYDSNTYLRKLCHQGLFEYLSENKDLDPAPYLARLEFELDVIIGKNLSDYMLIVADILNYGKNNGILIGPGRGSSGGSLIAKCLGITDIDPIKYNLLFERFISINRPTLPDVV